MVCKGMKFSRFPLDEHVCYLKLTSCKYTFETRLKVPLSKPHATIIYVSQPQSQVLGFTRSLDISVGSHPKTNSFVNPNDKRGLLSRVAV